MITRLVLLCLLAVAPALAQQPPIVIGAVVTETGTQAPLAAPYRKALQLWSEQVNAAGGLLDRRVELRLLDDASQAVRARDLYNQLMREKADLLIGPYGSAATLMALAETEREKRVLINGAGASHTVHKRAPRYAFQTLAPYPAYATGIVELAQAAGCSSLFITTRDGAASVEMAEGAHPLATARGLKAGLPVSYAAGTLLFEPLVAAVKASGAELWLAFGEVRDAAEIVRTSREQKYVPRVFFTDVAVQPAFIKQVGQWAELSLGTVEYDARRTVNSNPDFVKAYSARWSAMPTAAAARGYAAASVLAEGVRRAGSLDQEKLRAALSALEFDTVLGRYKVDPASGEQIGIRPDVIQIVKGRPVIVWPPESRAAEAKMACR